MANRDWQFYDAPPPLDPNGQTGWPYGTNLDRQADPVEGRRTKLWTRVALVAGITAIGLLCGNEINERPACGQAGGSLEACAPYQHELIDPTSSTTPLPSAIPQHS